MTSRYEKVLNGAAYWASFFRENPEIFVEQYLHIKLRLFQKILISMMFASTVFVFIAARGASKSYLSAIYCCARCILYPGTRICVASKTRGQGQIILNKIIQELVPKSDELKSEIDYKNTQMNGSRAQIQFKNTSVIMVVTSGESARGERANVLLLDEYRLIDRETIDSILDKLLNFRRMPDYSELTDEERNAEYAKEKNLTMFLSSAYLKDHWSYTVCLDTFRAMLNENEKQFVCGLPYQLSIYEGLLDPDRVRTEISSTDFSEVRFSMEMLALFWGSNENAFFDFNIISKNRSIKYPMLPSSLAVKLKNHPNVKIPPKRNGEIRLISADIALMSSKKHNNDATALFINQMIPNKDWKYSSNIVFTDVYEGLRTDTQALIIRKLFSEYQCDYLVLDTYGIGLGIYDALAADIIDPDTGEIYPALSCCNNQEMADRCVVQGAEKVIWSIKASQTMNSDIAFMLREGFRSGRIRLIVDEFDGEEYLSATGNYNSLSSSDKTKLQLPYINTTLLINELINLQHEESGGKIKIYEKPGMRKDRYSSLAYNYYVALQIENKMNKKRAKNSDNQQLFEIRAPIISRNGVIKGSGQKSKAKKGLW